MTVRRESTWLALLLGGYCISRLYALSGLPPFIDEAVHVAWARDTLTGRLLAGSWAGRWLTIKIMAVFVALPLHPLLGARLASVVAGAGALGACVAIARRLYSPLEGSVAGALYLVLPYALFYNRLALSETFAAAFAGAVLYFSVAAVELNRRRDVAALAVALVSMFLAKFYAIVLVCIPVAAVVLLQPRPRWLRQLARLGPAFVALALPFGLMVWRGHGVHYLQEQSALGSVSSQAALIVRNLEYAGGWFWALLTPPWAIALLLALLWLLRPGRERSDLLLAAAFLLSIGPFVLGAQIWFPRYLVPALVPMCVLLARFACAAGAAGFGHRASSNRAATRAGLVVASVALLAWPLWLDAQIILYPEQAALPAIERGEFFEGWSAGYGVRELADYLRARSRATEGGINVARFYFWDQAYQGLDLYLSPAPSLAIYTIDPTDPQAPAIIARLAAARATFFVLNPPNAPDQLAQMGRTMDDYFQNASRVWTYPRPGAKSALDVWQLQREP